jgi:hypothetical protein
MTINSFPDRGVALLSIQILVTCSDRKTVSPPGRLRLGNVPKAGSTRDRARLWIRRIRGERVPTQEAMELYTGEHWQAVRELDHLARAQGYKPRLWICSAGYGLVPANAQLKPYAATFSRGHPDSVERTSSHEASGSIWWNELSRWRGPDTGAERKILQIAESQPRTPVLVIASPAYLRAMANDLSLAGRILQDRLLIVSAGAKPAGALAPFLIPTSARLQHRLGGSKMSLNPRIGALLLKQAAGDLCRSAVLPKLKRATARMPALPVYDRLPLKDSQIRTWIRREIKNDRSLAATSALRMFRDDGWACEQRRFVDLFHAVREDVYGY